MYGFRHTWTSRAKWALLLTVVIVMAGLLAGCAATPTGHADREALMAKARVVAVPPLTNLTNYPKAGQIVAEVLATNILKLGNYQVVGPDKIIAGLGVADYQLEVAQNLERIKDKAKGLGANTMLTGRVNEYRYKPGLYEVPVVGIKLSLIDLKTSEVLWEMVHSGQGGTWWFTVPTLSSLTAKVCSDMINDLGGE